MPILFSSSLSYISLGIYYQVYSYVVPKALVAPQRRRRDHAVEALLGGSGSIGWCVGERDGNFMSVLFKQ